MLTYYYLISFTIMTVQGEDKPSPLLCLRLHRLAKPVHGDGLGEDKPSPLLCLRVHRPAKVVHSGGLGEDKPSPLLCLRVHRPAKVVHSMDWARTSHRPSY